jgi:phospholipase C
VELKALTVLILTASCFAQNSPIKHWIIITKENHSFVNYFGTWPTDNVTTGKISTGETIPLSHAPDRPRANCGHFWGPLHADWDNGKMDRFDRNCGTVPDRYQAYVQYYESDIPNYWQYAKHFGLARMFFPDINGASFAAHLALVGGGGAENIVDIPNGTLGPLGFCDPVTMVVVAAVDPNTKQRYKVPPCVDLPKITDLLTDAGVTWAFYAPTTNFITPLIWNPLNAVRHVRFGPDYAKVKVFSKFPADAAAGNPPTVVWLDPDGPNSDHPVQSVTPGENWLVNQINAIIKGGLWDSSVIFVAWDDPGGFYENVWNPDPDFFGHGAHRVPMMCIGPYCRNRTTSTIMTFASISRCLENVFGLPSLTLKDAHAADVCQDMLDYNQKPIPPLILTTRPVPTALAPMETAIDSDIAGDTEDQD